MPIFALSDSLSPCIFVSTSLGDIAVSSLLAVPSRTRSLSVPLSLPRREPPSWANEVMGLIELEPGVLMRNVFSCSQIYTGSKVRHFGEIRKSSSVPYEDMIFFDDWDQNCKEVGSLGVTCVECRRVRYASSSCFVAVPDVFPLSISCPCT